MEIYETGYIIILELLVGVSYNLLLLIVDVMVDDCCLVIILELGLTTIDFTGVTFLWLTTYLVGVTLFPMTLKEPFYYIYLPLF